MKKAVRCIHCKGHQICLQGLREANERNTYSECYTVIEDCI
uniref:Uncharacterized protein n=1 Tax=Anguilla anguilla TaxID=7936 RepID=A0A0E9PLP6_ANGAN